MINELKVELVKSRFLGAKIIIDGVDLLTEFGVDKFANLPAIILYQSLTKHPDYMEFYSEIPDEEGKTIIYSCNCNVIQCASIFIDMVESEMEVIWKNFEHTNGQQYDIGPFRFKKQNFENCLMELLRVN